jgi:serine/threonine-protein kinase
VYRCLEKDPAQRYPDLAELAHALAPYAGLAGRELASAVSRLLRRADRAAIPAGVPTHAPGTGTAAEREREAIATTQPEATGAHAPRGATPTTMGSAASSMATAESAARHRGVIAGVAGAAILAGAVAIAFLGGLGSKPTITGGASPAADAGAGSSAAAPSAPDAAVAVATPPPVPLPVDAGTAQVSSDAALDAGAAPSPTAHPPATGVKKPPPKKDRPRTRTPGPGEEEDFGATRH